jgi:hypothetical protein
MKYRKKVIRGSKEKTREGEKKALEKKTTLVFRLPFERKMPDSGPAEG